MLPQTPKQTQPPHLVKIYFPLDSNDWHGKSTESLWATDVSGGKFRINNSPFFAKGVSFDDIVSTYPLEGKNFFKGTVIEAGHSTYRIILSENTTTLDFKSHWDPLKQLGCTYESGDFGFQMFAVDVLPQADIHRVYELLSIGENDGVWDFEEGHCGHHV